MGFGGGGSNVTKPHTHDSNIVQDGGSLSANVTQFGLTAGSILYSDGSNIQELAVGSASDTLTVNGAATAPEWAAPGAGAWTVEGSDSGTSVSSLSVDVSDKDVYVINYAIAPVAGTTSTGTAIRFNSVEGSSYRGSLGYANYAGAYTGYADNDVAQGIVGNNGHTKTMQGWINVYKQNSVQGRTSGVIYRGCESVSASTDGFDAVTFSGGGNISITGAISSLQVLLTNSVNVSGEMKVTSMDF